MNWEAIGAIGEISGALAVVLTLLYLARQIKESRKATVAQIYQGRADAASRSIGLYPIGARVAYSLDFSDADEGFEQLSDEERGQLGSYLLDLMVRLDNLYFQYRQGFFPEDFFENVKQSIRMTQPLRSALGINVERILLSQTFRDLVRSIDDSRDA
jgi:hypothetical protein